MEELELPLFDLRFPCTKENHTSIITLEAAGYCSTWERAPGWGNLNSEEAEMPVGELRRGEGGQGEWIRTAGERGSMRAFWKTHKDALCGSQRMLRWFSISPKRSESSKQRSTALVVMEEVLIPCQVLPVSARRSSCSRGSQPWLLVSFTWEQYRYPDLTPRHLTSGLSDSKTHVRYVPETWHEASPSRSSSSIWGAGHPSKVSQNARPLTTSSCSFSVLSVTIRQHR